MTRQALERAYALNRELAKRRENDPLLHWKPTPKQAPFVESVLGRQKYLNGFLASNRSGKSSAGAFCGAALARYGDQSARFVGSSGSDIKVRDTATSGWVVAPDFPSARDIVAPKYFDNGFVPPGADPPFIPNREIEEWRVSDQILKLKNGSILGFKSCDSDRSKFQGTEKDFIHFDEEPPKNIFDECLIRIGAKSLSVFMTCTLLPPEGAKGGVSWVFSEIIQPWQAGQLSNWNLFGASIYDNPHIPPEQIKILESMYPPGSLQRKIRLDGEWLPGLSGSRAYAAFDRTVHVRPQHEINPNLPICWFWDFNNEPGCTGIGQLDNGVFRVFKEIILDDGNIPDMVDAFVYLVPDHRSEIWLYGDATGNNRQRHTREMESAWTLVMNLMATYGCPVRKKVPETNPRVGDRLNAVNRVMKDEGGRVRVEVDPECKELIADFEQVLLQGPGKLKKSSNREDSYFRRSHISDAFGYWVSREAPIRPLTSQHRKVTSIARPGYGFGGN